MDKSSSASRFALLVPLLVSGLMGCPSPPPPQDVQPDRPDTGGPPDIVYDIVYPDDPGSTDAGNTDDVVTPDAATPDASETGSACVTPPADAGTVSDGGTATAFCDLPLPTVPGAIVPPGVCIRKFAAIDSPRTLAFAPNGDLFVAAPSFTAPGGAGGGAGGILVLSDDNRDGIAEQHTFLTSLTINGMSEAMGSAHGLVFGCGELFFTTNDKIFRTPYTWGQRQATPGATVVVTRFEPTGQDRWTHGLAYSSSGVLYASQSVYSASSCPDTPRHGRVMRVDAAGTSTTLAEGMRNPMYMRCHPTTDVCYVAELGDDGGSSYGAREKLIRIRANTNYGFPCCATSGVTNPAFQYDCSRCDMEERSIPLFDTPFGFAWEPGLWPLPFRNSFVVAKHGSFYSFPFGSWAGAGVFFATIDPATKAPTGEFQPLVLGFNATDTNPLNRPADVAFAPDGRLFVADDNGNNVYWLAPDQLRPR